MKYQVIIEMRGNGFNAYVPDLPACVATGETKEEAMQNIREVVKAHLEKMKEQGLNDSETTEDE